MTSITPNELSKSPSRCQSRNESRRTSVGKVIRRKGFCNVIPTRYVLVFVASLANTLSYIMRTNMSVTIVAMVNHTSNSNVPIESCPIEFEDNQTLPTQSNTIEGVFHWDETMQGHILGSFYYGYIATNINAGQLADIFGARWLCGIVTLVSAVLTIITPFIARWDVNALILVRVCIGLCQGVLTPAIYSLLAKWIPRNERALVLALIQVGGNMGAVVSTILSGFLCQHGFDGGWPSVFYVFGIVGILCFILWMYAIYDSPDQHPRIHDDELLTIKLNIGLNSSSGKRSNIPWTSIMTSMPVWAISVSKFCGAWGNLMLMSKLPSYLKSVLHLSIQDNGYITSAVYIALSISLTSFGYFSDWIGKKQLLSDTLSRKIFETIALGGPAICLIMIPIAGCNLSSLVTLLVIAMTIFGLNAGGDKIIVVDLSPQYSGTIYGITNAIASIPGILSPLVVGFLINLVFKDGILYSTQLPASTYLESSSFSSFATAKPQPWGVAPRSRCTTMYSQKYSNNNSRIVSRIVSRVPSRVQSRRATFINDNNNNNNNNNIPTSRVASRRTTIIHNNSSNKTSATNTPNQNRKFPIDPMHPNDIFTIDLNKVVYTAQQQLGNKCETEREMGNMSNEIEYDLCIDEFEYDINFDSINFDDLYLNDDADVEEEKAQQLQYVRERRLSIFPIA
ncbi:hypothetical protein BLOT_014407 [Blomia tropicalis]|nr:hypothetical protein BLOT_014407 [Blomia tropicalis]